ncbi:MAG: gliding motility-associated C-terminal domain-containing protein [Bacteroidia bacterium]
MNTRLKIWYLFSIVLAFIHVSVTTAQTLAVNAGPDNTLCPGGNVILGGSPVAAGGLPPYTYSWAPAAGLSSTSVANPIATPSLFTTYTLTVTDDTGAVQTDMVDVTLSQLFYVGAGQPTDFCKDQSGTIGSPVNATVQGINFSWAPAGDLNDPTLPQPTAEPVLTTTYTLTSTIAGCPPKTDSVKVTVIQPPPIYAGEDITIKEGERATLHAEGGYNYAWSGGGGLTYANTADPDAEPDITAIYILYGTDITNRCFAYDTVVVSVIPSDDVVFYNTFTPNGDGNNDTWFIGNILKYPNNRLDIYNRNGKLVYKANGYTNNWDGKTYLGEQLPAATYFYIMDLRDGAGTFHGTVSIVK